jgi:hypothetical protein
LREQTIMTTFPHTSNFFSRNPSVRGGEYL